MQATVTTVLDAPKRGSSNTCRPSSNLPVWATEFARELKYEDGNAKVVNGLGEFDFSIDADADTGVIDMYAGPTVREPAPSRPASSSWRRAEHVQLHHVPGAGNARRALRVPAPALLREFDNLHRVFEWATGKPDATTRLPAGEGVAALERFARGGVRAGGLRRCAPSYGSVLLPLFEEDGLRWASWPAAAAQQADDDVLVRRVERDGLVERRPIRPMPGRP